MHQPSTRGEKKAALPRNPNKRFPIHRSPVFQRTPKLGSARPHPRPNPRERVESSFFTRPDFFSSCFITRPVRWFRLEGARERTRAALHSCAVYTEARDTWLSDMYYNGKPACSRKYCQARDQFTSVGCNTGGVREAHSRCNVYGNEAWYFTSLESITLLRFRVARRPPLNSRNFVLSAVERLAASYMRICLYSSSWVWTDEFHFKWTYLGRVIFRSNWNTLIEMKI